MDPGEACKLTASNLASNAVSDVTYVSCAIVASGEDLAQYMGPESTDTPFARFLKEENGLESWLPRLGCVR